MLIVDVKSKMFFKYTPGYQLWNRKILNKAQQCCFFWVKILDVIWFICETQIL